MPHPPRIASIVLVLAVVVPAQTPDWHRLPALTGLATKRLGFDAARERMVMFESSERGDVSRTWEWVSGSWSLRRPTNTPPPRQGFAAAYDPLRGRFVMFGGAANYYYPQAPNGQLGDTWEYDGIDWVQRTPTASPPPQWGGWLGFDYAAGKLLLCAGTSYPPSAGAWHYDGTTWTSVAAAPFTNNMASFATDPMRARIVALSAQNTTSEWDGTSWQTLATPQVPPARIGGAMTYVPTRGTVVLHGGSSGSGTSIVYYTDMWEWDGANWAALAVPPAPSRANHELAHDSTSGDIVLVGGFVDGNIGTDTLRWDGTNWNVLDTALGWETFPNAAFDPVRGTIVVIGNRARLRGLEWDGARWWPMTLPPTMMECSGIAYDMQRSRLVAVGQATGTPSTWERIGTTWSSPTPAPSLAYNSRLVWHGGRGRVLATCANAGLHEWDGTQWNAVPNGGGGPCTGDVPVYDAARNELAVPQYVGTTLHVHVWDGNTWSVRVPSTSPPLRHSWLHQTLGYDEVRQRVVLFGGESWTLGPSQWNFYQFFDDLWEWDGTDWSQRVLPTTPPARHGAAFVFDANRQQLLLIGGARQEHNGAHLLFSDVWALDSMASSTVTVLGAGCGAGSGHPLLVSAAPHPGALAFTIDLYATAAGTPCLFLLGNPTPPVALGAGCNSFITTPEHVAFATTNAGSFTSAKTEIPLGLQGFSFAAQAAVLEPASPLGFVVTQGLQITVGQ